MALGQQSLTVLWSHDQTWVVVTEIDFSWTYVGASEEAMREVLADARLQARRVDPADPPA